MTDSILTFDELKDLNFNLYWIYRRQLLKGQGCGVLQPPDKFLTMWYVEEGNATIKTVGRNSYKVNSGEWFICMPGAKRVQQFSKGAKIISLWLSCDLLKPGQPTISQLPVSFSGNQCPKLKKHCLEIINFLQQHNIVTNAPLSQESVDLTTALAIKLKTLEFSFELVNFLAQKGCDFVFKHPIDVRVRMGMEFLQKSTFMGSVPYDDLSRICGIGKVQLDRLFVKEIGLTPRKFLEQCCIQAAHELLTKGVYNVSEVAYRLNFSNTSHFCTWYKRVTGNSPKQQIQRLL